MREISSRPPANKTAPRSTQTGRPGTQARSRFRNVAICRPDLFAAFRAPNSSQIAMSSPQSAENQAGAQNGSQFAAGPKKHRGAACRPWALPEHGALMAANILRREPAMKMSVFVIRAFVRAREQLAPNAAV